MKNILERWSGLFTISFFVQEKNKKRMSLQSLAQNKWRELSGIAKKTNLQGIADKGGFLVGLNLK